MYMIDLHCHALFDVDDGAQGLEEMQDMLNIAYDDGIRAICFTPHFKCHHFSDDEEMDVYSKKIKDRFAIACEYVSATHPDMTLFLGNEIMYHHGIYDSIKDGKCFKIADTSYVLVEFLPSTPFFEMSTALSGLLRKGLRPILAHAERYEELVKVPSRVNEISEMGALIQINASSITNFKHGKCARFIKRLFKSSLVDLIATDSHDSKHYKPVMSYAVALIKNKYGEEYAKKISYAIPSMILKNQKKY